MRSTALADPPLWPSPHLPGLPLEVVVPPNPDRRSRGHCPPSFQTLRLKGRLWTVLSVQTPIPIVPASKSQLRLQSRCPVRPDLSLLSHSPSRPWPRSSRFRHPAARPLADYASARTSAFAGSSRSKMSSRLYSQHRHLNSWTTTVMVAACARRPAFALVKPLRIHSRSTTLRPWSLGPSCPRHQTRTILPHPAPLSRRYPYASEGLRGSERPRPLYGDWNLWRRV